MPGPPIPPVARITRLGEVVLFHGDVSTMLPGVVVTSQVAVAEALGWSVGSYD